METNTSATNSFTPDDMTIMSALIRLQGGIGAIPITQENMLLAMDSLNHLCNQNYAKMANPELKNWVDTLLTIFISTDTVYKHKLPAMFIAYNYYVYLESDADKQGDLWSNFVGIASIRNRWYPAKEPSAWFKVVMTILWWDDPPKNIFLWLGNSFNYHAVIEQKTVFSPKKWSDFGQIALSSKEIWESQFKYLQTLIALPELSAGLCNFLSNFLIALSSSPNTEHVNLTNKIANTICSSKEYPNSTMAFQLSYYSLMYQANPMGPNGWSNAELQTNTQAMIDAITNPNPAAQILKKNLSTQLKILFSDASYPMVDPYNPAIGFNVRMTDTLATINKGWGKIV